MGVSRISNQYLINQGLSHIQNNLGVIGELQNKISSGKNLHKPSDDPIGMSLLLRSQNDMATDDRFEKNLNDALSELSVSEGAISGAIEATQRARELAVQAANQTNGPQQLQAIQTEIDQIIEQVRQMGNTTYQGKYVFSGFLTQTQPFTLAGTDINYNGSPIGAYQRNIQISSTTTLPVNLQGQAVFGNVTYVAGVPTGNGILQALASLRTNLGAGNYTAIQADIGLIDNGLKGLTDAQATIGARSNQLEMTQNRIQDRRTIFTQQIANIQNVDLSSAISNLTFQDNIYQGSIGAMQKILQTSLVNFLG